MYVSTVYMYGWISINVNMFFDYHLAKYAYWCIVQKLAETVCPLQNLVAPLVILVVRQA